MSDKFHYSRLFNNGRFKRPSGKSVIIQELINRMPKGTFTTVSADDCKIESVRPACIIIDEMEYLNK